jgi:hypothetical protein
MKIRHLSKIEKIRLIANEMLSVRQSHEPVWKDIADYILPYAPRFLDDEKRSKEGERKDHKILNNTATMAANIIQSGMMGGVTSPSRPWFKLDIGLGIENQDVRTYLDRVSRLMYKVFSRSNLYKVLPQIYKISATFGTSAMIIEEDLDDVIRCTEIPIGSYAISNNSIGQVDCLYREISYTVRQLIDRFAVVDENGTITNANSFSNRVRSLYESGNMEALITVCHFMGANEDYDPDKLESKHKKYMSCYYEKSGGANNATFLKESGVDLFNVVCHRWEKSSEDVYGISCPGRIAIGDVKGLQHRQKRVWNALDKEINPPVIAPASLNSVIDSRPLSENQGVTYVSDEMLGNGGIRPLYNVQLNLPPVLDDIQRHENRINKAFHVDLFLMMTSSDRRNITAREVDERREEKLLALGPVLEQLNQDLLKPLIDITFSIMERQGLLPEPPESIQGQELDIEYISIMAQAQKFSHLAGIDRVSRYVSEVANFDPNVIDKIDTDNLVDSYFDIVGVSPNLLRSDDDVASIRKARQDAQKEQQMNDKLAQGSQTAKTLSDVNTSGENALTKLLAQSQSGNMVEQV